MKVELEINLYKNMHRIRAIESMIAEEYHKGDMRCPVHLSIGQEFVPGIYQSLIEKRDYAVSTHRGHAHYLSKGGNIDAMIAEIYGKKSGCSKGKGGSMHLIDLNVNFMGTSAIVGNSIPVGVGLGLSAKLKDDGRISTVFLGDGAVEEGVFYESVNFAVLKQIPVLFICENNLYSVYSPLTVRQPKSRRIHEMVNALGIVAKSGSASSLSEAYQLMKYAISYVREGNGPFFLEYSTYRWLEHCGPNYDNDIGYRSPEEFEVWQKQDPLNLLKDRLNIKRMGSKLTAIESEIEVEIQKAFSSAQEDSFPSRADAYTGVYAP